MKPPYSLLSTAYDKGEWGKFSLTYVKYIKELSQIFGLSFHNIIDVTCGTGELVHELNNDYTCIGSDISSEMINLARQKYPNNIFLLNDIRQIKLEQTFDLVISPFDSINYILSKKEISQTFFHIYKLLNKNGCFLFDFNTIEMYKNKHKGIYHKDVDGIVFDQICHYNFLQRTATTIFDFGTNKKKKHIQKAYTIDQVTHLLTQCGFKILYSTDIYSKTEVNDKSYKVLILAQKY